MSASGEPSVPRDDKQTNEKDANGTRDLPENQRRPQAATSATTILPPQPHELTAEWTVRAQLTFARAGEKVQREYSSNDPVNPVRVVYKWSTFDSPQPPDDDYGDIDNSSSSTLHTKPNSFASRGSSRSTPLKTSSQQHNRRWQQPQTHESFRSTTSSTNADFGGGDSAFSGSNTSKQRQQRPYQRQTFSSTNAGANGGVGTTSGAPLYGTRCRSTCNIVVSAVADFLPTDVAPGGGDSGATTHSEDVMKSACEGGGTAATHVTATATATDFMAEDESDPFVFNTTASYTLLPQQSIDSVMSTGSKNFATFSKVLALRDAFSQTSDTETKYFEEREREYERRRYANSRSPLDRRIDYEEPEKSRKSYEQRHATTERLLQTRSNNPRGGVDGGAGESYVDEANSYTPSFLTSPSHTFKSASMSRIPTMPQQTRTQQQHQQQMLSSKQKSNSSEPLKKPRTVHIDVYCTGSEDEEEAEQEGTEGEDEADNADAEASASSDDSEHDDGSKHYDLESNSTPQTVFDNEQMLLKHKRIQGQILPRRLQQQQQQHQQQQPTREEISQSKPLRRPGDLNIGHAITKSSTAEEVSESKQLLFRKHIGDQRAVKLAALRQKYMRQPSDDAISSNYPNSSRSTMHDATCSSIASSVMTSSHAEYGDSSLKDTEDPEEMYSLAKSDSFEYENSTDRLRIKQMERFWSRTTSLDESAMSSHRQMLAGSPVRGHPMHLAGLQPITEVSSQRDTSLKNKTSEGRQDTLPSESEHFSESSDIFYTYPGHSMGHATFMTRASPARLQQTSHFPRNRPGFLQFFGPSASPSPQNQNYQAQDKQSESPIPPDIPTTSNQSPRLQRWKSETRDSADSISPHQMMDTISPSFHRSGSEAPPTTTSAATFHQQQSPIHTRRFEMKHDSPAVSDTSTNYVGYTVEHLLKAKKFGTVVIAARKPGHHVGPTKNPNCTCESCQRWRAERFQIRNRAFSLGERPILRRPT